MWTDMAARSTNPRQMMTMKRIRRSMKRSLRSEYIVYRCLSLFILVVYNPTGALAGASAGANVGNNVGNGLNNLVHGLGGRWNNNNCNSYYGYGGYHSGYGHHGR